MISLLLFIGSTFHPNVVLADSAEVTKVIYLTRGQEASKDGDGTQANPYQSLEYALEKAEEGHTIKLLNNILFRKDGYTVPYLIPKAVTIDGENVTGGENYSLTFQGSNVELGNDLVLKNLTFKIIQDASVAPALYVNNHNLTLDNVSTKIGDRQSDVRPSLYSGRSGSNTSSGVQGNIVIQNGSSETRFKKIELTEAAATLNVSSEFAQVDEAVYLKAQGVSVETNARNIKKFVGDNDEDSKIKFNENRISNVSVENVKHLEVAKKGSLELNNLSGDRIQSLNVEKGSRFTLPITNEEKNFQIVSLKGAGTVELQSNQQLSIDQIVQENPQEKAEIVLNGFEGDLRNQLNKEFVVLSEEDIDKVSFALKQANAPYRLVLENGRAVLKEKDASTDEDLSEKYNPKTTEVVKEKGTTVTEEEIKNAIYDIPENVELTVLTELPDGNQAGIFDIEVEILYEDGSIDEVHVTVNIQEPKANPVNYKFVVKFEAEDGTSLKEAFEMTLASGATYDATPHKKQEITVNGVTYVVKDTLKEGSDPETKRGIDKDVTVTYVYLVKPTGNQGNNGQGTGADNGGAGTGDQGTGNAGQGNNQGSQGGTNNGGSTSGNQGSTNNGGTSNSGTTSGSTGTKPTTIWYPTLTLGTTPSADKAKESTNKKDNVPNTSASAATVSVALASLLVAGTLALTKKK